MARTVADQFLLAAAAVKRIYGIVGDSLNGLTDSLRRQGKIIGGIHNTLWSANWIRQSGSQHIIGSFNNGAVGIQALDRARQVIAPTVSRRR